MAPLMALPSAAATATLVAVPRPTSQAFAQAASAAPQPLAPPASLTLLERGFPFRELSQLVAADRRARDPSYGIHRWWARRPPALVRGMLLAAFAEPSTSEEAFWKTFGDAGGHLFGKRIHDPFLGGGSTVVEAARLGALASGTDVDPLACMIARHELSSPNAKTLREYGEQLASHLRTSVESLYQPIHSEWIPLHWFWLHAVKCPACKKRVPLYRNLVIARDVKKAGAVVRDNAQTVFCPKCFEIHHLRSRTAKTFECCGARRDIRESTFSGLKFHCPSCSKHSDHSDLKTLTSARMLLAVEETHPRQRRRIRAPHTGDRARLTRAEAFIVDKQDQLLLPPGKFTTPRRDSRPISYGADKYTDLFHPRQLATFGLAFAWIKASSAAQPIKEALALATSHALAFNNRLCGYATDYGRLSALFSVRSYSLPALSVELNPLHPSAGRGTLVKLLRERLTEVRTTVRRASWDPKRRRVTELEFRFGETLRSEIRCASALATYPSSESLDFSFFDPPYFDYIAYSELSEFYRAWLDLQSIGGDPLLPEATAPVTSFASSLATAMKSLRARLKPSAPFAFTFHSRSQNAWLAIAESIKQADERITALWPVLADPHMGHHGADGACEWDLVIVCRPTTVCRAVRAPSLARWRDALRPLAPRKADREAFAVALHALKGLFGSITGSSPSGRTHEGK